MSSRRESDFARLEQLLEQERRRADNEQRHRKEADERAELERHRADEQQQRADEQRQRVDEQLQNLQEAESRARIEREKTRQTTFEEYLRGCHTLLSKPLCIQTDKSLSTRGSITYPKTKPCPTLLKPWEDFPIRQQQLFARLREYIAQNTEHFSSIHYLTELGKDLCDRPLASEKDLEAYQRFAVERPTTNIISHLQTIRTAREALSLGDGIIFENHANTLADTNEEVHQSLQNLRLSQRSQAPSSKAKDSDQLCVYKARDGRRSVCMVVEYKPAHKLSVYNLRAGLLRSDSGSLNLPEGVINRPTIPTDPEEKFVYHSEWLVGAALTQTYGYMVESGLEYSYLTTGEAFVFLHIKEAEPHTLYYHLAEPNIEAEAQDQADVLLFRTAVSQTSTFCLFALDSEPRSQMWRNQTLSTACKAMIDYETILRQIPAEEKALTPPSSVFRARVHPVRRSPILLRPRRSRQSRSSCRSTDVTVYKDSQSPAGSSDETSDIETPSKPRMRTAESGNRHAHAINTSQASGSDLRQRQYCTQACLLGLVRRSPLDDACPNVSAHRAHGAGSHHALDQKALAQLVRRQLARDPDDGCEPLWKQGARGALFRLTLDLYGYTLVGKGTVRAFKVHLKHEGSVYRHLEEVQGEVIPVYLGNISLTYPYFLDVGVKIVHMLLMSWAGEQARRDLMTSIGRDIDLETTRAVIKLRCHGVEHHDVRPPNVLWNSNGGKIMLVDFERSEILKHAPALSETSLNAKRRRLHSNNGGLCLPSHSIFVGDQVSCLEA